MEIFWDEYRKIWTSKKGLELSKFLQTTMYSEDCPFDSCHYNNLMTLYEEWLEDRQ